MTTFAPAPAGLSIPISDDFDLEKIFECGQCFRWNPLEGGYAGVAMGRAAAIRYEDGVLRIIDSFDNDEAVWRDYFDLGRSYASVRDGLAQGNYMRCAADFGRGIRILNQERWESLCSFIISQCNNIPRIKGIVERLCEAFGDKIDFMGQTWYSFPAPDRLASLKPEDLKHIRAGYRAAYIISAARAVSSGELDLEALASADYWTALAALKGLEGVGDKVANCAILFGLRIPNAFPIDTWMKKALREHFEPGFVPEMFGDAAGLAQQYIFYYARSAGRAK